MNNSTTKKIITLQEAKSILKSLGYKTRLLSYSEFKALKVFNADGLQVNGGNVFTKEHFEKFASFYAFKNEHEIQDGFFKVVL